MRFRQRLWPEEGTVVVLAAVLIIVVMGFAALAIDVGMITTARAELQNVADAGALAGVSQLLEADYDGAVAQASAFGSQNTCVGQPVALGTGDIELGNYDLDSGTFTTVPGGGGNAIRVTARRSQGSPQGPLPLFFMGLLGPSVADVEASAIAAVDNRVTGFDGSVVGILMPFTVHQDVVGVSPTVGFTFNLYPNQTTTSGGSSGGSKGKGQDGSGGLGASQQVPGNFGLLDLDSSNPGTNVLRGWIEEGYPGEIEIPASGVCLVDGEPGFRNTLRSSVEQRIGDPVVVLVHSTVSGQGSNAVYTIVSLLAIEILSVDGNGINLRIDASVAQAGSSGVITRSYGAPNVSVGKLVMVN